MAESEIREAGYVEADRGLDIRRYLGIVRARFWIILAGFVVIFTFSAIRTFRATPIYQATARLLIERRLPRVSPFDAFQYREEEGYLATQVKLITSKAVLEKALEDEGLAALFESRASLSAARPGLLGSALREVRALMAGKPTRPSEPWERLRGLVNVEPVRDTNLVDIRVAGADPPRTALIANAVGKAYVAYTVAMRQESALETFKMLQQQRKEQEEALRAAEEALLAYREKTAVPQLGASDGSSAAMDRLKRLNEEYTGVQLRRMELSIAAAAIRQVEEGERDLGSLLALGPIRSDPALADQLKALNAEYARMRMRRIELREAVDAIRKAQGQGEDVTAMLAVKAIRTEPTVSALCERLAQLDLETHTAQQTFGERHPELLALENRTQHLRSRLSEAVSMAAESIQADYDTLVAQLEEGQDEYVLARLGPAVAAAAESVQADHQLLLERERQLAGALAEQNRLTLEQARTSQAYERLRRDVERQTRVFDVIVDRMKEADLTKDVGVTNVSLVEQASVPRGPISPNKRRSLFLGAFLGLLLGLGMAFGLEYLDDTVKTSEDVERRLGLPWLGYVPTIRANGNGRDAMAERATHALMYPQSSTTESFRSIRTNIYFSGQRDEMKSIAVTSAVPQEGKTIFAANLAATVAQDGKRVLLVDADFRRPTIHTAFGVEREPGLTNMLLHGMSLEELVQTPREGGDGSLENLHILCAGHRAPNPGELLGGKAMAAFVREARQKYDMVIYDSSPAMFVADAASLSSGCDGLVMVLKWAKTRRDAVDRARKQLEALKGKIVGAVLNGVRPKAFRYYGYRGYGYYHYDYQRYYRDYAEDEDEAFPPGTSGDGHEETET